MAATTGQQMQKSSREAAFFMAAFHARFKKKSCLRSMSNVFNMKSIEKAGNQSASSYFF
ncbi:hypothetical protein [Comamonas jiangduensis]|uniref:hypothetical protein n=1 Tax=Comamonas jiangduensis TaxID=1194168 RepID=UPI0024E0DE8F|nr:hypothetical protein [Comamonas jiangduensis]